MRCHGRTAMLSSSYPGVILQGQALGAPVGDDKLVLYSHTMCPYAQRVWLTVLQKQVEHTLVHVDLSNKPAFYKSLNPRGLVPCVAYRGKSIVESDHICKCAHPPPPLTCRWLLATGVACRNCAMARNWRRFTAGQLLAGRSPGTAGRNNIKWMQVD